jgi:hypothetical protein
MGPLVLLTGVSALLAPGAYALPSAPLGVVVLSQRALLGGIYIVDGTSLFDGDTVSTHEKGLLRIRIGESSLAIGENSILTLRRTQQEIRLVLLSGKAQFSIAAKSDVVMDALGAAVSARTDSASGIIAVVGANEFQIASTHGSLKIDVDGDVRTVTAGMNYDVKLSASPEPAIPVSRGKKLKIASWTIIAVIAGVTALAVQRATLSRSHPHL